jgi:uncharacterized protein YxeA
MKKYLLEWLRISGVWVFLTIILSIVLLVNINSLTKENTKLKEELSALKVENESTSDALIERNQELYLRNMELEEWKQLFYSAIDFHPDESYPY